MMRHRHMDESTAPSDEILDEIGAIAMHRHATAAETGHAVASREALQKLEQLLAAEREAEQAHGPGGRHAANIAALTHEIEKLKSAPQHERGGGRPGGGRPGGGRPGGGGGRPGGKPQGNFSRNKPRGGKGRGRR